MYTIDDQDSVTALHEIPPPSAGAPMPIIYATEDIVRIAYWGSASDEEVVLVTFVQPYAHLFGPPNDEALHGHPLYSRGLDCYAAFEIRQSSWIRGLEKLNCVHERHDTSRFVDYRHFIITFHDTTLECVAEGFTVSKHEQGSAEMHGALTAPPD